MERVKGIEPSSQAWEAHVLPLNHTRTVNLKDHIPARRRLCNMTLLSFNVQLATTRFRCAPNPSADALLNSVWKRLLQTNSLDAIPSPDSRENPRLKFLLQRTRYRIPPEVVQLGHRRGIFAGGCLDRQLVAARLVPMRAAGTPMSFARSTTFTASSGLVGDDDAALGFAEEQGVEAQSR